MKRNNIKNRFGGAILIIIILIIVIGAGVGIYYGLKYKSGKELQEKQTKLWEESFTLFNQKQPEAAYLKLNEVRSTFNDDLVFYRGFASSSTYIAKEDVNEIIVLICQSEIYDTLFKLESAENWIVKAKEEINNIGDAESKKLFESFISRAESANKFCQTYKEYVKTPNLEDKKYQDLVKESLKVGTDAIKSSDYDYTIFEIRFLIACGKSFKEPILLTEARKQLFDITQSSGEDEKTKLLWRLLRN